MGLMICIPKTSDAINTAVIAFRNWLDLDMAIRKAHGLFGLMLPLHVLKSYDLVLRRFI